MHQLEKRLTEIKTQFDQSWQKLQIDQKLAAIKQLESAIAEPELWLKPDIARSKNTQLAQLNNTVHPWLILQAQLNDLNELLQLGGQELSTELTDQLSACEQQLKLLKQALYFNNPYDHHDAILRITAGVGGTEAMDWAAMLERMYLRFAQQHNFKTSCLDRSSGEEAGIKTAVYEITGTDVYGLLRSEHGVHRLVRLSPFNADHLRQTSFALVEILPIIEDSTTLQIDEKDLRIDVFHAGGHGGQSVNTTNSAVRVTHIPTNTVVTIQNERSQLQNKTKALEVLRGKLVQLQQEQQAESIDQLRAGEAAKWGQQIRNYILQPYKLVKDTRTKHESKDPDAILDGKIDDFITAFLEQAK